MTCYYNSSCRFGFIAPLCGHHCPSEGQIFANQLLVAFGGHRCPSREQVVTHQTFGYQTTTTNDYSISTVLTRSNGKLTDYNKYCPTIY